MKAAKQIAKLTPHGVSLMPVSGSTDGTRITPSDVAASVAMIKSRPARACVLAKFADDQQAKYALYLHTYNSTSHMAREHHWFRKKYNDELIRKLACTAVNEHIHPRTCSKCNGHGQIAGKGTCSTCGGLGKIHYRSKHYCEEIGLSRSQWWRIWANRYGMIIQRLETWEQIGLNIVLVNLR